VIDTRGFTIAPSKGGEGDEIKLTQSAVLPMMLLVCSLITIDPMGWSYAAAAWHSRGSS